MKQKITPSHYLSGLLASSLNFLFSPHGCHLNSALAAFKIFFFLKKKKSQTSLVNNACQSEGLVYT